MDTNYKVAYSNCPVRCTEVVYAISREDFLQECIINTLRWPVNVS